MDPPSATQTPSGALFENALTLLQRREGIRTISTGSPELDHLFGGLEPGLFHLFYGDKDLPDLLLLRLMIKAVEQGGRVTYLLCGNYRRSRTVMDPELLLSLIEEACLDVDEALSNIHVISAFSERHLIRAPSLIENLLEKVGAFNLVAVQQLAKLFHGRDALRFEKPVEFTGLVSRLKTMCSERELALAATCRSSGRGKTIPTPEGGSFLRHAANVVIYLRKGRRASTSAYVVKHPDRARSGTEVHFGERADSIWAG